MVSLSPPKSELSQVYRATPHQAVIEKRKPFEIRKNDRNFQSQDNIILNEYKDGEYTGRFCVGIIQDIFDIPFLMPGYVAFTFKLLGEYEEMN